MYHTFVKAQLNKSALFTNPAQFFLTSLRKCGSGRHSTNKIFLTIPRTQWMNGLKSPSIICHQAANRNQSFLSPSPLSSQHRNTRKNGGGAVLRRKARGGNPVSEVSLSALWRQLNCSVFNCLLFGLLILTQFEEMSAKREKQS